MIRLTRELRALLLIVTPPIVQAFFIRAYAVNVPVWDELSYVPFIRAIREGGDWLPLLVGQDNEHRMMILKIIMVPLVLWARWNVFVEMYVSLGIALLSLWGLWRLASRDGRISRMGFVVVSWLVFNLAQYQNILHGMQISFYFTVLSVVWAVELLSRSRPTCFLLASVLAWAGSSSTVNGLLIWPVGLLLLAAWHRPLREWMLWGLQAIGCALLYARGYTRAPGMPSIAENLSDPASALAFAVVALGSPIGAGSFPYSLVLGVSLLLALGILIGLRVRRAGTLVNVEIALLGLVAFAVLSACATALGRAAFGVERALESRYITFTSLAVIGSHLLAERWRGSSWAEGSARILAGYFLTFVVVGLTASQLYGVRGGANWRAARLREKYILQTFEAQPDEVLAALHPLRDLRAGVPYLKAQRLSVFSDPMEILLPVRWREGVPTGELVRGGPVVQSFVCPVARLSDVAVVFATYQRRNTSQLDFRLFVDGQMMMTRHVPAASVHDNGWVSLQLAHPLERCEGRSIRIEVESPDAYPGNAVAAWTYPPYYEGRLEQPRDLDLAGRSLGIALNGFSRGVLAKGGWAAGR